MYSKYSFDSINVTSNSLRSSRKAVRPANPPPTITTRCFSFCERLMMIYQIVNLTLISTSMMISPVRVFRSIPPRTPLPTRRCSRFHPRPNKPRLPRCRLDVLHSVSGESSEASSTQGQMSTELIDSMKNKIQEALSAESVEVVDVEGDGQHVTINVISSSFEGEPSSWTPSHELQANRASIDSEWCIRQFGTRCKTSFMPLIT